MNGLKNLFGSKSAANGASAKIRKTGEFIELVEEPTAEVTSTPVTSTPVTSTEVGSPPVETETTPKVAQAEKPEASKANIDLVASPPSKPVEAPATAQPKPTLEPEATAFSTKFFLPLQTPRRSPGPSLKSFMDMAQQMTTRQ